MKSELRRSASRPLRSTRCSPPTRAAAPSDHRGRRAARPARARRRGRSAALPAEQRQSWWRRCAPSATASPRSKRSSRQPRRHSRRAMLEIPNIPHPARSGRPPTRAPTSSCASSATSGSSSFAPRPHWEIGEELGIIDFERGVKISGSRFYVLTGRRCQAAARPDRLDARPARRASTATREIYPPAMVKRECLFGTGKLPKFGDNLYHDAEEDFWFVPTAEVPVTNLYRDEMLEAGTPADLPRRLHALLPPREDVRRARRARHQARPPVRQGGDGEVRRARRARIGS